MASEEWGGLPVVRKLSDVRPRCRVEAVGQIMASAPSRAAGTRAYMCQIDDGTGHIILAFTGRSTVAGLSVGVRCRVEGTAQERDGLLMIFNPDYEIEATGCN